MKTYVEGVYRNGVVHLTEPLPLPDDTRVEVAIHPIGSEDKPQTERERVRQILRDAGLLAESFTGPAEESLLSEAERQELAERLGRSGPVSDLIIQDREDRI